MRTLLHIFNNAFRSKMFISNLAYIYADISIPNNTKLNVLLKEQEASYNEQPPNIYSALIYHAIIYEMESEGSEFAGFIQVPDWN